MIADSNRRGKKHFQKRTLWQYIVYIIGVYGMIRLISTFIPIPKQQKHSMFKRTHVLVMAHRGGAGLAPENTLVAFRNASKLGVDIIELDIQLTNDGHLVVIHDSTINRTTNGTGAVNDLTLEEVQSYDAGFHFRDPDGNASYRGKGVIIPTLESVFQEMPQNMRYTIEVKHTNNSKLHETMVRKLWKLMKEYGVQSNVLIGSFDHKIIDTVTRITNGAAIVSAGRQEVIKFVLLHKLRLHFMYKSNMDSIDIPLKVAGINLVDPILIKAARDRGIDVHYWSVNDQETMQKLINLGVDGIISDRPDVMMELQRGDMEQ